MVLLNSQNPNDESSSNTSEDFIKEKNNKTHLFRYINIFTTLLEFSTFARIMVTVLTTLSNGRKDFSASYAIIARQLITEKDPELIKTKIEIEKNKAKRNQIIRRRLKTLEKEQIENNFSFFNWKIGDLGKDANGEIINIPTSFTTLFYEMFQQDLELAYKELHNYDNLYQAMDETFTKEIKKRIQVSPPNNKTKPSISEKEKKYNTIQKQIKSLLNNLNSLNDLEISLSPEELTQTKGKLLSPILDISFLNKEHITPFRKFIEEQEKKLFSSNENETLLVITKREEKKEGGSITKNSEEEGGITIETPSREISSLGVPFGGKELSEIICGGCKHGFSEVNENDLCDSCYSMLSESQQMIMLFDSVGIKKVDFNMIAYDPTHPKGRGKSLEYLYSSTDEILGNIQNKISLNFQEKAHLFFRPRDSGDIILIQLDDIKKESINSLKGEAFLTIETSFENYQCWLALEAPGKAGKAGFVKFIKDGFRKLFPSDNGATNSIRACSKNLKSKYAPNFPIVTIVNSNYGRVLSLGEVRGLGINVDFEEVTTKTRKPSTKTNSVSEKKVNNSSPSLPPPRDYSSLLNTRLIKSFPKYWKMRDYSFFFDNGKLKGDGSGKDFSAVDFGFACQKLKEGVAPGLVEEEIRRRAIVRGKHFSYSVMTVKKAQEKLIEAGFLEEIFSE